MADGPHEEHDRNELLLREAAKLMGLLFIGRRDAKAIFVNGQWVAQREKYTLSDFRKHLFGDVCLGSYLLTPESNVRTMAFDIDLVKENAPYHVISDVQEIVDEEMGELDLETKRGNLEAALHDESHEAHRWARSILLGATSLIVREVYEVLGLTCTPIVTGGGTHVFVPFGREIPASEARAMGHSVMEAIPIFHRRSESFYNVPNLDDPSISIEVFPKQDTLTDSESLGNLIRLPFGMHECGIRTYALDPKLPQLPSWSLPKTSSMDALRLQAACLDLEWDVTPE